MTEITQKEIVIFTDGGARGNPGHAGIGAALYIRDRSTAEIDPTTMTLIKQVSKYIGETTNNVAEYTALQTALETASELEIKHVRCVLDSELVVKQLNGEYRIKEPTLQVLAQKVKVAAKAFESVTYSHVRREKNKLADQLVNQAIDEHLKPTKN